MLKAKKYFSHNYKLSLFFSNCVQQKIMFLCILSSICQHVSLETYSFRYLLQQLIGLQHVNYSSPTARISPNTWSFGLNKLLSSLLIIVEVNKQLSTCVQSHLYSLYSLHSMYFYTVQTFSGIQINLFSQLCFLSSLTPMPSSSQLFSLQTGEKKKKRRRETDFLFFLQQLKFCQLQLLKKDTNFQVKNEK